MSSLPKLSPMDLLQVSAPFDDPDFLYEVKFDGFRALAYVDAGHCELVSRKGARLPEVRRALPVDLPGYLPDRPRWDQRRPGRARGSDRRRGLT